MHLIILSRILLLQLLPGQTSGNIVIAINPDHIDEQDETLIVKMGTPVNAIHGVTTTHTATITDDDYTPEIAANQTFSVDENSSNTTTFGVVAATDDNSGTNFQNWTILAGNATGIFGINSDSGELSVEDNTNLDYETNQQYVLTLSVSDGFNTSIQQNVTININDVNDNKPVIDLSQSFTIDENLGNNSILGTLTADDVDTNTTLSNWTILDGNINNAFAIDPNSGEITVNNSAALDREAIELFNLQISVSDGIQTSNTETVVVNLNDLNDNRPIIQVDQSFSLAENPNDNFVIGTISVSDADVSATTYQNWAITSYPDFNGNSTLAVAIDPDSGELTVNDPGDLDCENILAFTVKLKVSDGVDYGTEEDILINVTDVNDVAPVVAPSQSYHIDENLSNGSLVGNIQVSDGDFTPTNSFTFACSNGNDGDAFELNDEGEIRVKTSTMLDREQIEHFELTVKADDGINCSEGEIIVIHLDDVNEFAPQIDPDQSFSIDENPDAAANIGTVTASDPDAETIMGTWSITGGNDEDYSLRSFLQQVKSL